VLVNHGYRYDLVDPLMRLEERISGVS
jgi:hypothetical protein